MSVERCFLDTNVLIYLFDGDSPGKQARARALLDEEKERIVLSTQVLGEFYVNVTRKLEEPLSPDAAAHALEGLSRFEVKSVTAELVLAAVRRSRSSLLSYWDSLIVETARHAGAEILFTEDLQHGQEIEGLRIVNPFANTDPQSGPSCGARRAAGAPSSRHAVQDRASARHSAKASGPRRTNKRRGRRPRSDEL